MFIKFNGDNIWEIVQDGNVYTFYKRVLSPKALRTTKFDEEIDEDKDFMKGGSNFNYKDWKVFFGEERLKKLTVDLDKERFVLPMIYYAIFNMGLTDMVRERETKFTFRKRE